MWPTSVTPTRRRCGPNCRSSARLALSGQSETVIGKGAQSMFRASSWRALLATGVMFFVVSLGFLASDLRPQAAVATASALLMTFVAGYAYRARLAEQAKPPRFGSLWLDGDEWPTEGD